MTEDKQKIKHHWEDRRTGTRSVDTTHRKEFFQKLKEDRKNTHPFLKDFAAFDMYSDQRILEIGIGPGTDFQQWVEAGTKAVGIDISEQAIELTNERLQLLDLKKDALAVAQADAERLPFDDNVFDLVYSYGALHHTPDFGTTLAEANRVLKPGGDLKLMVYGVPSWVGFLLWFRFGLLEGKPSMSQKEAIYNNLESPGTRAFSDEEIIDILKDNGFEVVNQRRELGPGDLLLHQLSDTYDSFIYNILWKLYPRWLIKRFGGRYGTPNLITATKPEP